MIDEISSWVVARRSGAREHASRYDVQRWKIPSRTIDWIRSSNELEDQSRSIVVQAVR
jgi:hypothetical protein